MTDYVLCFYYDLSHYESTDHGDEIDDENML